MNINDEEYLKHVGVLGMKWGHRKGGGAKQVGLIPKLLGRKENFRLKPKGMSDKEFDKEYAKETREAKKAATARRAEKKKAYDKWKKTGDRALRLQEEATRLEKEFHKTMPMKEKVKYFFTGDPRIPMGKKLAATALVVAGSMTYAYLKTPRG